MSQIAVLTEEGELTQHRLANEVRLERVFAQLPPKTPVANGPRVNAAGGRAFADWILSPTTQSVIAKFGVEQYGRALFTPIAGKRDEDL